MRRSSSLAIWSALLAIWVIWGSTYLAIRYAVASLPPYVMAGTRFTLAGSTLYLFRRWRGDPAPTVGEWRGAAFIGFFLLTLANGLITWAEQWVPSGVAAVLIATVPLWMVFLDWGRPGGRRPSLPSALGALVGFAGVTLLLAAPPTTALATGTPSWAAIVGAPVCLASAFFWATGSLYGRTARLPASPLLGTGMEMMAGGAGLLLIAIISGEWSRLDLAGAAPSALAAFAYLVVVGAWVGYSAYVWLLRVAPTPLVATYAYVNPVVALVLGNLIAGEPLTARSALAAGIIIGSVIITTRAPRRHGPKAPAIASDPEGDGAG